MAKRSSTLAHSKRIENAVCRYLWGNDTSRDWTERHDISGTSRSGFKWFAEVKDLSTETLAQRGGELLVAYAALEQVIGTKVCAPHECFAWIHRKSRQLDLDVVAVHTVHGPRAMLGKQFRELAGGGNDAETD